MILTFMMSQAQAESESMSGNIKWGHRKNFKDGKVYFSYATFLGYRKGEDGQPEIVPEEAAIVRRIFSRYLMGQSVRQICKELTRDGVKTATGKDRWYDSVIQNMLQNERYMGDALLQKTFTADIFTRQQKKNNGELPKYYVHDCLPPIIDRGTFQQAQEEIARRASLRKVSTKTVTELSKYSGKYALTELLSCGECGTTYRRVTWTQNGAKRVVWRCVNRLDYGKRVCKHSPTLDECDIHAAVVAAMNERFDMQAAKSALLESITAALAGDDMEQSLPAVESRIKKLQDRQLELFELITSAGADCTDYVEELRQVNMAKTRLMTKRAELQQLQQTASDFDSRIDGIAAALEQDSAGIAGFDEITVRQLVSNIKVLDKQHLLIRFKDGVEIEQLLPEGKK